MTREIPMTNAPGVVALVDDEDYERVMEHGSWHRKEGTDTRGGGYAVPNHAQRPRPAMHRVVMGLGLGDPGLDHRNGDRLDNRKENLRIATASQNQANTRKMRRSQPMTSRFKGVSLDRGRWLASIRVRGRKRNLGRYGTEEEASAAYERAAREAFGEFARAGKEALR